MGTLLKSIGLRSGLSVGLAALTAFAVAGLGLALFWPESPCSDPVCARYRFSVFVELDAFKQVEPTPLELKTDEGRISVASVLATGGIDVNIVLDQTDLPYDPSAGRLNDADLYQLAQAWRNRTAPASADAKLYAVVAPRLISNTGEALFGIMFDTSGREGFAVAPVETVERFSAQSAAWIPALQMRTFLHELLHALNRDHLDGARIEGGRLTIEAPTRCIADTRNTPWSLQDWPSLTLSPATIRFFQTATATEVLPGKTHKPFERRRSSANECQELREKPVSAPAYSRWALAIRRLKNLSSLSLMSAYAATEASPDIGQGEVSLHLQALPSAYPLGYPVAIRLVAINNGRRSVPLRGRLNPSFGILQIDTRTAEEQEWQTLRPLVWFEPADDKKAMLDPGQSTEQTVPVYFGDAGWTFPAAGSYEVRARLKLGDEFEEVVTPPARIEVIAPKTDRDVTALHLLMDADGRLDVETGRLVSFGGRIGEHADLTPVERLVEEFADTALGSALKLTVASRRLRRPLDPATGTRPPPNIAGARHLLANACTDSGVAALKHELLQSHDELSTSAGGRPAIDDEHVAWDGLGTDGSTRLRTYFDSSLEPVGPSIHFCVDERRMRNTAWNGAHRLARTVRAMKPARVVVIGHTDDEGGCGYNDDLGLMRAESVKNVLVKTGIRPRLIQTVTLGKRRPVDFSSTEEAQILNRRVEVLIEPGNLSAVPKAVSEPNDRAIPSCISWEFEAPVDAR